MQSQEIPESIPLERRKEIFLALVEAQDTGMSVEKSRREIGRRFGATEANVKEIESEGVDNVWPPL